MVTWVPRAPLAKPAIPGYGAPGASGDPEFLEKIKKNIGFKGHPWGALGKMMVKSQEN